MKRRRIEALQRRVEAPDKAIDRTIARAEESLDAERHVWYAAFGAHYHWCRNRDDSTALANSAVLAFREVRDIDVIK